MRMRLPFELSFKIAVHILKNKLLKKKYFALVLQLEPLHLCNLSCSGCGRIREYVNTLDRILPLQDCLTAVEECEAPMVSICGGEPLIYPHIEELVHRLISQKRIVYLCTNGLLVRKKLVNYLSSIYTTNLRPAIEDLYEKGLISSEDLKQIRSGSVKHTYVIAPSKWFYWNIHIDGFESTHDAIVERKGVFKECVRAIVLAKQLGFQVAINTTVYLQTDMQEIELMFEFFSALGVDGYTISPGYDYDAAKLHISQRLGKAPEEFFLTRANVREKFKEIETWGKRFNILGTPIFQEFLAGKRELTCSAWAIPTFNPMGWRSPCYLIADKHYASFHELIHNTNWEKYGVVDGIARDSRCQNCMTHCGYDPTGALSNNLKDIWKNLKYTFGPRPICSVSPEVKKMTEEYLRNIQCSTHTQSGIENLTP